MKKLIHVALVVFAVLLFSCKGKQQAQATVDNTDSGTVAKLIEEVNTGYENNGDDVFPDFELKTTSPQPIDPAKFREYLIAESVGYSSIQQRLINDLLKLDNTSAKALVDSKEVLKKYFKNATAKQCDSLYLPYYSYAILLLSNTANDEYYGQVPSDFFNTYDSFEKLPPAYQPIMKELNGYGIQLEDIGEGCADLSFYPDYFYELFKPYTTEATRRYLELLAYERANEFLFDAAVTITWEELAGRIVSFEEFLNKHSQSMFAGEIKDMYNSYTGLLLTGCDNTPTCDWHMDGTRKLNTDAYEAYQRIIETYNHRRIAKILKEYCSIFEKSDMVWNEELDEFIAENDFSSRY